MIRDYFKMFRPFTLVAVILGSLAGGIIAMKDMHNFSLHNWILLFVIIFIMSISNASGNVINEIFDQDIDKISKPYRSLVSGKVKWEYANSMAVMLFGLAIVLSFIINILFGIIVAIIEFFAWNYSAPPLRFKKRLFWGSLSIATPRGALGLFSVYVGLGARWDSWTIAIASFAFAIYVFAGNWVKDFPDYDADKNNGIRNFVTVWGIRKSAIISIPFYYVPFITITAGALLHFIPITELYVNILLILSAIQTYYLVKDPLKKWKGENGITWMIFYVQMGLILLMYAIIYVIS